MREITALHKQDEEFHLPEKKCALKPFLETVLSDLNSMRMLLNWEVMTSGTSVPQYFPCSFESDERPLRTSTKSYLHTFRGKKTINRTSDRVLVY